MTSHGANVFDIAKSKNIDVKEISDFSSNINPLGASKKTLEYLKDNLNLLFTYPDPKYIDLKKSIADYTNSNPQNIILGLGATEILKESIKYYQSANSMILSPCYSEYEEELEKINSRIFYFDLNYTDKFKINVDEIINAINLKKINLLVFANPNNPTGTILKKDEIKKILQNTNVKLIVDETYVEFCDQNIYSSGELTKKYENLLIVRGTSKFFSLPGIRLGYGLTSDIKLIENFKNKEVLWQINSVADICGQKMFKDDKYLNNVYSFIETRREYLLKELNKITNLEPIESKGNFILVKIHNEITSTKLRQILAQELMIIRDCKNFRGLDSSYFRFCILSDKENEKLLKNLRKIFN